MFRNNKKFNTRDTLWELAICTRCGTRGTANYSQESMERIAHYFTSRVDWEARRERLKPGAPENFNEWIEKCELTGTKMEDCTDFKMSCDAFGTMLSFTNLPMIISLKAVEEIDALLSAQTREEMEGFLDQFPLVPPELKELLSTPMLV